MNTLRRYLLVTKTIAFQALDGMRLLSRDIDGISFAQAAQDFPLYLFRCRREQLVDTTSKPRWPRHNAI